jgi:hypothetical protein
MDCPCGVFLAAPTVTKQLKLALEHKGWFHRDVGIQTASICLGETLGLFELQVGESVHRVMRAVGPRLTQHQFTLLTRCIPVSETCAHELNQLDQDRGLDCLAAHGSWLEPQALHAQLSALGALELCSLLVSDQVVWLPGVRLHDRSSRLSSKSVPDDPGPNSLSPQNQNVGKFRYVDLFAGVGGFRVALDALGGHCVFSSGHLSTHARVPVCMKS